MTFDKKDHDELLERKRLTKDADGLARHARLMEQAAVSAKALTGDQKWDIFLQNIQATIQAAEVERDGFEAILTNPNVVSHDQLILAKIGLAEVTSMIRTCRAVLDLPKDIIAHGEQARSLLERMETVDAGKQS